MVAWIFVGFRVWGLLCGLWVSGCMEALVVGRFSGLGFGV